MQLTRLFFTALAASSVALAKLNGDQQAALDAHNSARKAMGKNRPMLKWDPKLESEAAAYAQVLAVRDGALEHAQERNGAGENLWMSSGGFAGPLNAASKAFLDEKKDYPNCMPISMKTEAEKKMFMRYGHFTQCVWPKTTKVGMAVKVSKSGKTFVVARYFPSGNMLGQSAC